MKHINTHHQRHQHQHQHQQQRVIQSSVSRASEDDYRSSHRKQISGNFSSVLEDECSEQSSIISQQHARVTQREQEFQARNARAINRNKLVHFICCCITKKQKPKVKPDLQRLRSCSIGGEMDDDLEEGYNLKKFRLEAVRRKPRRGICGFLCCCFASHIKGMGNIGLGHQNRSQSLAMYLHWSFRVNFLFLFIVSCVIFFALIVAFTALILLVESFDHACVRIAIGDGGADSKGAIADAFALSWTTFATVGYGSAYPSLSNQNDSKTECFAISAICSLESFIGVLYSGFCGAILFGKVLRIQSHAEVMFSEPIVVKYGSGLNDTPPNEEQTESVDDLTMSKMGEKQKIPFPVLEFRIVNRLFNEVGGEIMDATLNVVANVDANDAVMLSNDSDRSRTVGNRRSIARTSIDSAKYNLQSGLFFSRDFSFYQPKQPKRDVQKRVFSKMTMESGEHPFFKRVWAPRHILDESSPILTHKARKAIRKNGGTWPERLNNAAGVRESLKFNQILVSLNGISNVSASDVNAQQIYDFADLNVGYDFVNLLYRDGDGLKVDTVLINDVREQNGGGGETLSGH